MDLLLILGTLLGIFLLHSFLKPKSNKKNGAAAARYPPEPAGRLPIIGHLRILAKEEGLLATLGALAEKHGSIFGVSIGSQRTVVVSSAELAKECLTTHDKILATRSKSAAGKYLAPNYTSFSLCEYGPYWRKIRKIATQELLSFSQIKLSKHIRTQEVNLGMTHLYKQWAETGGAAPVLVEMSNWFRELMFNIMVMSIVGKRYFGPNIAAEEQEVALRFQRAVRQLVHLMGVLIVSDAIPSLEWLDLGGHIAALKKTAKEMDSVLTIWLEEHRQCTASGKSKDQPDFIDIMFSIFEGTNDFFEHDPNTVIKSTALGDMYDHESLVKAIKQVHVVISAVGFMQLADQVKIIDAIKEAGTVKRFFPSEFVNDVDRVQAVEPARTVVQTKVKIRRAVEAQGIPYTYVSANFFAGLVLPSMAQLGTSVPPRDKFVILGDGNPKAIFVKEEDIATYTIKAVDDQRTLNKVLYIRPPANLYSFNDLASAWEKKIEKPLERIYIPEEEVLKNIKESPTPMGIILATGHSVFVKGDHTNFDIQPSIGVEASQLYPEVKYITVDKYLNQFV